MRIGQVIGKTVLSVQDPACEGGRWLVVNPLDASQLNGCCEKTPSLSAQPSLIVYDNIGAGEGDIIGFSEGGEATAPFPHPIPIDALCIAIFDQIHYTAFSSN